MEVLVREEKSSVEGRNQRRLGHVGVTRGGKTLLAGEWQRDKVGRRREK